VGDVPDGARGRGEVAGLAVLREFLLGGFESVHVALVVGVVMPREDLFADRRLERVVVVRKRRQFGVGVFRHEVSPHTKQLAWAT
jgi:hypothetical protein